MSTYEEIRKKINDLSNMGGPPLDGLGPTACDILTVINDCCKGSDDPLCKAMNIPTLLPYSCMIDLIDNNTYCGQTFSQDKLDAAYKTFAEVTHTQPDNTAKSFNTIYNEFTTMANYNAFYMFVPVAVVILLALILMIGFQWIHWGVGLFMIVLVFVIFYGFSVVYRINIQNYINTNSSNLQNELLAAQKNYENSISYWPQGLFAVACSLTCTGGNCWKCSPPKNVSNKSEEKCGPCKGGENKNVDNKNVDKIPEANRRLFRGRKIN